MLLHKVSQSLKPYPSTKNETHMVVGVSGGADSLALMHILHALAQPLNLRLHVATLDHGLRGDAGAADAQFVVETAQAWGLSVTLGHADLDPYAPGVEARARTARYKFLADVARTVGVKFVVLAHHADDQAETVLMRLLRGTGTAGLAGMRLTSPMPHAPDLTLLRPLLNVTRAEIEAYNTQHDLQPRQDATNDDTRYLRNRIRLETLPQLRRLNPQITQALNRVAQIAAEDDDYIEGNLSYFANYHTKITEGRITLERWRYKTLDTVLRRRFILRAAKRLGAEPDYDHVIAADALVRGGKLGAIALLGDGIRVRVAYEHIAVEHQDTPFTAEGDWAFTLPVGVEIPVIVPGDTPTSAGWRLRAMDAAPLTLPPEQDGLLLPLRVPADAQVMLRTRREGDRFAPPNLKGHTQKLKKYMIDLKIAKYLRDNVPLMIINANIAAILLNRQWIVAHGYSPELTHEGKPEGEDDLGGLNQLVFFMPINL